jgi:predicted CopG family antitoxin
MTTRMHRTQILLEPEQHQALTEIARREQRSLSDVVREMLHDQLKQRRQNATAERKRRLEALERIKSHRQAILDRRGGNPLEIDVVELINQMRDERDAELTRFIQDRG